MTAAVTSMAVEHSIDMMTILRTAAERNATDIHLQAGVPPILRIQKRLVALGTERLTPERVEELMFPIMSDQQKTFYRQNMEYDFSYGIKGLARFRINVFRQRETMAAALRKIPYDIPALESLGVPPAALEFPKLNRGFVLVTGPTGHGKSTTLASVIDRINRDRQTHIITLEDPIEYLFQHKQSIVVQRELGTDTHSFANALRSCLREDPDVILVGEMRDLETIGAALTAAETGHLVFATLHTNSAAQTIDRIIDVFPPYQQQQIKTQLAGVLSAVMTQQLLVRKNNDGLVLAAEVLLATPAVKNLIREGKAYQIPSIMQTNTSMGMMTMDQSLVNLVSRGAISYEQALDHAFDPREVQRLTGRA